MSMFSHQVELNKKELTKGVDVHKSRRPPTYPKGSKTKKISKEMEEGTLKALKEMLARQKQTADSQNAMSAINPFEYSSFQELSQTDPSKIEKLDPSAQVMQLYDKMVETLLFIDREGIQETTLILDGDAFSSSLFQGSQITLTEYNTAPKVFNIQFSANLESLSFFQAHAQDLLVALQKGNFGFSVHRIDTEILPEKIHPRVEREEKDDDE